MLFRSNAALKLQVATLQTRQREIEARQVELEARLIEAEIKAKQERSRQNDVSQKQLQQAQASAGHISGNQGKENVFLEPTTAFGARSVNNIHLSIKWHAIKLQLFIILSFHSILGDSPCTRI